MADVARHADERGDTPSRTIAIDVRDRAKGECLTVALQDETVRACVAVMLALLPLPTRARHRVLAFVADQLNEEAVPAPDQDIRVDCRNYHQMPARAGQR